MQKSKKRIDEYEKKYEEAVLQARQALQKTLKTDFIEPYKKSDPPSLNMLKHSVKLMKRILLLTGIYPEVKTEHRQLRKKINKTKSFIKNKETT